jgi:hypothetical protein
VSLTVFVLYVSNPVFFSLSFALPLQLGDAP